MGKIYGKEKCRFTYNLTDDYSCVTDDTLDWVLHDTDLDDNDTSVSIDNTSISDTQDKVYDSSGVKDVTTQVEFDDGWGNKFKYECDLTVTAYVYDVPRLDFSWTPESPTILEETTFTQNHDDTRDDTIPKSYGRIDSVDVDYYNSGTINIEDLTEDDEFKNTFNPKEDDGIDIKLLVEYWDGWETQNTSIVKHLTQTNIPPVSESVREDNGICIPHYIWTAESTDIDDATDELSYKWTLSKKNSDDEYEDIDTGTDITYEYPFQYEGDYKLILRTTDDDGDYNDKVEEFSIAFDACSTGDTGGSGVITLQPNRFQDIAIAVKGKKVKEYFLDKIEDIMGSPVSDYIELVKAFPSSDTSSNKYLIYVPGVTKDTNSGNFDLVQTDGDYTEITAFRVKTKDFEGTIEIPWDSKDGE